MHVTAVLLMTSLTDSSCISTTMFTKRPGEEEKHFLATKGVEAIASALKNRRLSFALCGNLAFKLYMDRALPEESIIEVMVLSPVNIDLPRLIDTISRTSAHHFCRKNQMLQYFSLNSNGIKQTIDIQLSLFATSRQPQYKATFTEFYLVPYKMLLLQALEEWYGEYLNGQGNEDAKIRAENLSTKIQRMLKPYVPARFHQDDHLFDPELYRASKERVEAFMTAYPRLSIHGEWSRLGLDVATLSEEAVFPLLSSGVPSSPIEQSYTPTISNVTPQQNSLTQVQVLYIAAQSTVRILHRLGLSCAIFGSLACKLYGNSRTPNDVDILVNPGDYQFTQEQLKEAIVQVDPENYVLRAAKDPGATYRVLHYRRNIFGQARMYQVGTKIDLVLPGTMNLPALPFEYVAWNGELPVVPYSVLLLQKLQSWDDHLKATERRYTRKVPNDVDDVSWLLSPGRFMEYLKLTQPWNNRALFSDIFLLLSMERVKDFCFAFPEHSKPWRELGFETD